MSFADEARAISSANDQPIRQWVIDRCLKRVLRAARDGQTECSVWFYFRKHNQAEIKELVRHGFYVYHSEMLILLDWRRPRS